MRHFFITLTLFGILVVNSFVSIQFQNEDHILSNLITFDFIQLSIQAGPMPDPPMNLMSVLNECKVQEKATDADVQGFLSHKIPQIRTGKCLMACVFEKNGDVMQSS